MKFSLTISQKTNSHPPFLSLVVRWSLLSFLTFCLFACNKDSDPSPSEQTALLTAHSWLNQNLTAIVDGKSYTDKSQASTAESTFNPDGSYLEYYPADKTSGKGTWKLSGKTLTMTMDDIVLTGEITKLTADEFVFSLPQADVSKLDPSIDFEDLQPNHKDYLAYVQVAMLYLGDFSGFDLNSSPKKIQLAIGFVRK